MLRVGALRDAAYRKRLRETTMIAQIRTRDGLTARWYEIRNGRIRSKGGLHENPDVCLTFANARIGAELLTPPIRWDRQVHAQKNFQIDMEGPGDLTFAFAQLVMGAKRAGWRFGTAMRDGSVRYTSMTNGGPCFVHVRDGRILRITPIDFDGDDAASWTVTARGKTFTPPRKATVSPHTLNFRSVIYSKDRLLHPMKRVDFDPAGERNPQNRGRSGYERISWDEAFDLVAAEITRVKKDHGHGAITFHHPSHHNWGNVGYWLSALYRFANSVGHTKINHNPDSWEGWFWGAVHHWGNTMRFGPTSPYGTMQDLLDEAELVVFWSSDPEATSGAYAGHEGTVRRQWLKTLGIECIHIDPYYNHTAAFLGGRWIAPRPGTDTALALAIAYVWIQEGLYDRWFVENRTHGFDAWKAYILGEEDGIAKSPSWQEPETGVPARVVTALAKRWGTRKTYLSAGGWGGGLGGACRGPTGIQWARAMACLMALQGMGKPGVNFGNLQFGAPVDQTVWFPGYADGGISGDLIGTGSAMALYTRMPHLPTVNTPMQQIPRLHLPEAITGGKAAGEIRDPRAISGQFLKGGYPAPGHAEVRMLYRYGSSNFGTMPESRRYEDMYRSPSLEFVVNQSIWMEGEVPFADVILPACTNFERWDISEWSNSGGPILHAQNQCNHRVITLQHKCIEPLGEVAGGLRDLPRHRDPPRARRLLLGGHE